MPTARKTALLACLLALVGTGCDRDMSMLVPAIADSDPLVFDDTFGQNTTFQSFGDGAKLDAVDIDRTQSFAGGASLRVTVPGPDDSSGLFAGGAITTAFARDLSGYDAVTFYAKASMDATLNVSGLGNDNTGTSLYMTTVNNLPLTTSWQRYVLPIPLPSRLTLERGLFWFAEGHEGGEGYQFWLDEIRFEKTGVISDPRPVVQGPPVPVSAIVGARIPVPGTRTTFDVAGEDLVVEHFPGYFDFSSSNDSVATVEGGTIVALRQGQARITGSLDGVEAQGSVGITVVGVPEVPAPAPTHDPADVISLFSDSYPDRTVDTWSASWDSADPAAFSIQGNPTRGYTNFIFAGIEFISSQVDATAMTHLRMDIWVPSGTVFRIKLVDFGANGVFQGGDDSEHELTLNSTTDPAITNGEWLQLDIELSRFTNLTSRANLAQIVLSSFDARTVYFDNVYFRR